MAKLWRKLTTTIAAHVMWEGKHRSGVVQHLMVDEYLAAKRDADGIVMYVAVHKLGYDNPATIVVPPKDVDLIDR